MDKKRTLIPLLLPLILSSCGGQGGLESSSTHPEESSEASSSVEPTPEPSVFYTNMAGREKDASYLYDYLCYVGAKGNFTLSYELEGVKCYDLFNEDYYYASILNNGGILLPSLQEEGKKWVYRYEMDGSNVDLLLPENSSGAPVTTINDINYFSYYVNPETSRYNLKEEAIKKDSNGNYYIDDSIANLVLAGSVGYLSLAAQGLIKSTSFAFLPSGDISFTINALSLDSNGDYQETVLTKASFSKVDESNIPELEAFKKDFAFAPSLPLEAGEILSGESLYAESVVTEHAGNETPAYYATSKVSLDSSHLQVESQERGSERVYSHFYEKSSSGRATILGLNGQNDLIAEDGGVAWGELLWPKGIYSNADFRRIGESTYRYYGFDVEAFFYSFTYLDFQMAIKSMDAVVENGAIKEIDTTLYRSVSDEDSSFLYYTIKTTFSSSPVLSRPAPYKAESEQEKQDQQKIEYAFSELTSGHRYEALMEDYGSLTNIKTKMTVADNIVLFESYDGISTEEKGKVGYVEKEGKVIPFQVIRDSKTNALTPVVSGPCVEGDTLDDHIGFSASPLVFQLNSKNQLTPKPNVLELSDDIIGGPGVEHMVPESLSMQLDENGRVLNIGYRYLAPSGYGQDISGNDRVTFSRYGTAVLPPNLTAKINGLTPKE